MPDIEGGLSTSDDAIFHVQTFHKTQVYVSQDLKLLHTAGINRRALYAERTTNGLNTSLNSKTIFPSGSVMNR